MVRNNEYFFRFQYNDLAIFLFYSADRYIAQIRYKGTVVFLGAAAIYIYFHQ